MNAKTCSHDGCGGIVRVKEATEMPTLTNEDETVKTVFDVRYCSEGHNLGYYDRQEPIGENALIRRQ